MFEEDSSKPSNSCAYKQSVSINTLAIPVRVVAYSFNIIDWKWKRSDKQTRKSRKLLTLQRMHHPKADMDRMYLPRNEGGRGLHDPIGNGL